MYSTCVMYMYLNNIYLVLNTLLTDHGDKTVKQKPRPESLEPHKKVLRIHVLSSLISTSLKGASGHDSSVFIAL